MKICATNRIVADKLTPKITMTDYPWSDSS
ncbi:hypothetical protein AGR1B_pTi0165 [Agrobacterium fabacearum S56]|nr:hypothetical protein AGR1B_pTi0165 [Agrobacterium fabacearum S56]